MPGRDALAPAGRHAFWAGAQRVYEWEQTLDAVDVYLEPPAGLRARDLFCEIGPGGVRLGAQGAPPFLEAETSGRVKAGESFWTLEDGELHVTLQKLDPGEPWPSVFKGHAGLDPQTQERETQRIMLERFQEENPGFDFSGAEFSGACPNPRTFMGGAGRGA